MTHTSPQKLELERFAARELSDERARDLEVHLKECSVCKDYYMSLIKERETFLRVYPFEELAKKRNLASVSNGIFQPVKNLIDLFSKPMLYPVYAALLLFAVVTPFIIAPKVDTVNYKGSNVITFAYQRNGSTAPGSSLYKIQSGDRVQVYFTAGNLQYASLLSVDEQGNVSFYHPDMSSVYCTVNASGTPSEAFPGSIQFDKVTGNELVLLVLSDMQLKTSDVQTWVSDAVKKYPDLALLGKNINGRSLGGKSNVSSILLKKE